MITCSYCGATVRLDDIASTGKPGHSKDMNDEVLGSLRNGRKIEAIKIYRRQTGAPLKESKEAVEKMAADAGIVLRSGSCLAALMPVLLILLSLLLKVC